MNTTKNKFKQQSSKKGIDVTNDLKDKNTFYDKIYFIFLLILPLIYSTKIVDPVLLPRQFVLSLFVLFVSIIIFRDFNKKREFKYSISFKNSIHIAFIGFLIFVVISISQAKLVSECKYVFSKYLIEYFFFCITSFLLVNKLLKISILIRSLIVVLLISLLLGVYQLLNIDLVETSFSDAVYEVSGTFGHKNLMASFLFLCIPFLLVGILLKKEYKKMLTALSVFVIIFLWLIQSRAVLIALILFFGTLIILYFKNKFFSFFEKKNKIVLFSGLVLVVCFGIFTWLNSEKFSHLLYADSINERIDLWDNTLSLIKGKPLTGVGVGNWQIHFSEHGLDKFNIDHVKNGLTTFQRPHNDFLWVFSETGVFGFVFYLLIFVFILFYAFKAIKLNSDILKKKQLIIWTSGIIGYLFIGLVDFPLERMEHQIILMVLFSIIVTEYESIKKETVSSFKYLPLTLLLIIIGSLYSCVVTSKRLKGEIHTQNMYGAKQTGNWQDVILEAELAESSYYTIDPTSIPLTWYKGVAFYTMEDLPNALLNFKKAYATNPYNIHVINNLASCYESLKQHEKAIYYYQKVLSYSSNFEEAILNLSAVYYNVKDYESAFKTIEKCSLDSKDEKYTIFLPAIVRKKIEKIIEMNSDFKNSKDQFKFLESNENVILFYTKFKKQTLSLEKFLKKYILNQPI